MVYGEKAKKKSNGERNVSSHMIIQVANKPPGRQTYVEEKMKANGKIVNTKLPWETVDGQLKHAGRGPRD